jgi:magnesium-transporting ATPase (P-type)
MKNGKKLKLGDAHVTPRNIQEVQASKLGDAPRHPLLHRQKLGHLSRHYIFIASCIMRFFGASVVFAFSFFFAAINSWITSRLFGGRHTLFFIAKNTLVFTLIVQQVFSFSATAFSFCFLP